jgi:hypothetical protein
MPRCYPLPSLLRVSRRTRNTSNFT